MLLCDGSKRIWQHLRAFESISDVQFGPDGVSEKLFLLAIIITSADCKQIRLKRWLSLLENISRTEKLKSIAVRFRLSQGHQNRNLCAALLDGSECVMVDPFLIVRSDCVFNFKFLR